jgi:predicted dehydrogenase
MLARSGLTHRMPGPREQFEMEGASFRGFRSFMLTRLGRYRHRLLSSALDRIDTYARSEHYDAPDLRATIPAHDQQHTGIAFVGCGFVADFYAGTLAAHPELHLVGVTDRDTQRAEKLAARTGAQCHPDLASLLTDPRVQVLVNLTNPASHYAVSKASIEAGKHVYSEKPLATNLGEAEHLVRIAAERKLILSSAPCSVLGETAQALRGALEENVIGPVRLVYAELDDGPIHRMYPDDWASPHGTPWPWRDEFSVGCTIEHAGYHLTWLVALFGPAETVTAFSSRLVPHKHPDLPADAVAPDFSVACIAFRSGVVARLTCSIVAPHDHSLRIVGDRGVLTVDECWHFGAPVRLRRYDELALRAETYPWLSRSSIGRLMYGLEGHILPASPPGGLRRRLRRHEMDYLLGVSEVAAAVKDKRIPLLSAEFALHVTEIVLAIAKAGHTGSPVTSHSPLDAA